MSEKLYQIQPLLDQNQILLNSIDQNRKEGTLEAQERNAVLLTALGQSLGTSCVHAQGIINQ